MATSRTVHALDDPLTSHMKQARTCSSAVADDSSGTQWWHAVDNNVEKRTIGINTTCGKLHLMMSVTAKSQKEAHHRQMIEA